jgi:DNA polymerase-3 subunit epsilon
MSRQIVLDTETTGLSTIDGHRIIEIGCIELINRQRTYHDFHSYVNPKRAIDAGAQAVHGITLEFLADKPVFCEIIQQLLDYLRDAELVIHNAAFDVGFLDYELKLVGAKFKSLAHYCTVLDTLAYARKKHAGQRNSLDALCKRYSVDNTNRKLHGALLDAELLTEVYLAMTGGQASLLIESDLAQINPALPQDIPSALQLEGASWADLIVVEPSAAERAAHKRFMEIIRAGRE